MTLTVLLLAVGAYVVSYRVTQIDPGTLITSLPKAGDCCGNSPAWSS